MSGLLLLLLHGNGYGEHAKSGMSGGEPSGPAPSGGAPFDNREALEASQSALGRAIGDYQFRDQRGDPVSLRDYLGKPLLISFVYTSCYHICPTTTRHLYEVVKKSRDALGSDSFNVVSIGFDAAVDTPARMARFSEAAGIDEESWGFLSGDPQSIAGIAEDLGFTFFSSPKGFDHLIQTSVITGDGEVYRQVYGMNFATPLMIEPLKDLVFGTSGEKSLVSSWSDRIRFFCTVYDPAKDRYRTDYSIFIGTFIAFACVGLFGLQLAREWRLHLRAAATTTTDHRSSR
ncbi:MAG: SCO family protein [Pseudomonadales bacterium]|nr:SCO family protein [Pseudomonadales bacterium]MDP7358123.1 SCO family protein [Pseudomonadales bacterium]HJN49474.1 SCO family protein [Pseudomonadales bacterium]